MSTADEPTTASTYDVVADARMMPILAGYGCHVQGVDLSAGMIRRARSDHPGFDSRVGNLTDLPFADGSFDGVFSWYSTIHSPDAELEVMISECHRVLRKDGCLLLAFQVGQGMREVVQGYRDRGFDVTLYRWHRQPEAVIRRLEAARLSPVARMERQPVAEEHESQAVIIARRTAFRESAVAVDSGG